MGQDLSLIREWHLKDIWINADQAVSLGTGLCRGGKEVPLSEVHMSRSRNSPLEDDGKDGNGSNYQEGQTPERRAHDQRQPVLHHLRALPWQGRHTHACGCRGQELCRVSFLLTETSPIIPSLTALCSPVTVPFQCLLSYIWKASAPSEYTFSSPLSWLAN